MYIRAIYKLRNNGIFLSFLLFIDFMNQQEYNYIFILLNNIVLIFFTFVAKFKSLVNIISIQQRKTH